MAAHNFEFWYLCQGRNRHIFLWGQSHFSWFFPGVKCFFPVENSHFGTPKTNFRRFQKWNAKKKKKKGPHLFPLFLTFPSSLFPFTIFLLFFAIFTPFPFFPCQYVSKNFPLRSLWGHFAPPACYATDLCTLPLTFIFPYIFKFQFSDGIG